MSGDGTAKIKFHTAREGGGSNFSENQQKRRQTKTNDKEGEVRFMLNTLKERAEISMMDFKEELGNLLN